MRGNAPLGKVSAHPCKVRDPDTLSAAADGSIWFVQANLGRVGRVDTGYEPPITAQGTTFEAREDKVVRPVVAAFTDADPDARARDYEVEISWGDGDRSRGEVRRLADGSFEVVGRHEYREAPRTHRVVVRISDGEGKGDDAKAESLAIVRR